MLRFRASRPRPSQPDRRRPSPPALVERLEDRQLLTYSPLGYSPPDLTVAPQTPPLAAYGGAITVTVDVDNLGAASMVNPINQEQGAPTTADAGPSVVGVYLSTNPHGLYPGARTIRLGGIDIPGVRQKSVVTVTQTLAMPATRPAGFPSSGGRLYLYFRADDLNQVTEADRTNNITRAEQPLLVTAALPSLNAIAIQVPDRMQPGDVIAPSFKLANLGATGIPPQGPLLVQLVASTDQNFGPTDVVLASFTIADIPPLSAVPSRTTPALGDVNINDPANVITLTSQAVQIPAGYRYIGLAVDPFNTIRELKEVPRGPSARLQQIRPVGPPIPGLPPAGVVSLPANPTNQFPIPPFGLLKSPYLPLDAQLASGTVATTAVTPAVATAAIARSKKLGSPGSNPKLSGVGVPKLPTPPRPGTGTGSGYSISGQGGISGTGKGGIGTA